ncbi:N-acetylglucosamine-6-phosphate deacetylase [Sporosarcina sp. OR05]|uniref:N-acetylglucosamine-6-phosphate deacetylase n=1 Tax=Sporosarcina sp. OR05 TaxID=2969819 RepID=UPI003529DC21
MTVKDNKILLKGAQLYVNGKFEANGYVKVEGDKIVDLGIWDESFHDNRYQVFELMSNDKIIPGFIDIHIHGAADADTMDATVEALETIANVLPSEGTTSFLATTITSSNEHIEKALVNVKDFIEGTQPEGQAEIVGIHLEGPFINPVRAGAQPLAHIRPHDRHQLKEWLSLAGGHIKQVTLAPEQTDGLPVVELLTRHGVITSIGHSDATFEVVRAAVEVGATCVTHLFNQMRGLHHREPGTVGAAFLFDEMRAEIIVDGIHVRPEMVQFTFKQKGKEGLILITDAMRAKYLGDGVYDLGGQQVTVTGETAMLEDGALAGSVLKMVNAVKNMMTYTGCSLADAIMMASENPARQVNVFDRKGSLAIGKDADIVILNESNQVVMTFCRGLLAYTAKGECHENH